MAIEQLAEDVVNEVAANFEEAAEVTRKINAAGISYFAVGLGVGAAVGFYFGRKFNREKIRAEAYAAAEEEVAMIRDVYRDKAVQLTLHTSDPSQATGNESVGAETRWELSTEKPPIEQIIEKRGYSVNIPERERPLRAPVPILDDLPENPVGTSKSMNAGWNYEMELANRSPEFPYVIHQNEFNHSNLNYSKVEYTFYAIDEMIVDPNDGRPVHYGNDVVGMDNLKFGHGSDDAEVVYVRNDNLERDMQITRINQSFEEEVLGFQGLVDDDNDDDDDDDS